MLKSKSLLSILCGAAPYLFYLLVPSANVGLAVQWRMVGPELRASSKFSSIVSCNLQIRGGGMAHESGANGPPGQESESPMDIDTGVAADSGTNYTALPVIVDHSPCDSNETKKTFGLLH